MASAIDADNNCDLSMNAPKSETFRFPWLLIGVVAFGLILFTGMALVPIVAPTVLDNNRERILISSCGGGFALFAALCLWISLQRVAVDQTGVLVKRPGFLARQLKWSEIVRLRDRPYRQVLELQGDAGQQSVHVHYMLKDFARLREIISANASTVALNVADAVQHSLPMTFCRGIGAYLVLSVIGVSLLAIGLGALREEPLAGGLVLGLALLLIVCLAATTHSLTVTRDSLILHGFLRRREISIDEVTEACIQEIDIKQYGITSGRQLQLLLKLKAGKPLALGTFKDQTIFVRDLIEATRAAAAAGD